MSDKHEMYQLRLHTNHLKPRLRVRKICEKDGDVYYTDGKETTIRAKKTFHEMFKRCE